MGKRSRPNHSGEEPRWKVRRMDKVDRAQQEEIDAIQALFRPEVKFFHAQATVNGSPCIVGTTGTAGGPYFAGSWASITQGVASDQRVGDSISPRSIDLSFGFEWHSHVTIVAERFPIVDQRLRIDKLYVRGDVNVNSLAPERLKEAWDLDNHLARKAYCHATGINKQNSAEDLVNYWRTYVRPAGHHIIKPPRSLSVPIARDGAVYGNVTGGGGLLTTGSGTILPNATSEVKVRTEYNQTSTRTATMLVSKRWNLKRTGKLTFEHGTNVIPGHEWIPVYLISWHGTYTDVSGQATEMVANNVGAAQIKNLKMVLRFTDT